MIKRLLVIFYVLSNVSAVHSQVNLFGTTSNGGTNSKGTIFSYQPSTNTQRIIKNLDPVLESPLGNSFIQGSDGKLYGMTTSGGVYGFGAIFSFDTSTNTYTDIHDFNNTAGASPNGGLIQLTSGLLYGLTSAGGANGDGVIFSFDPAAFTYVDIYDFDGTHGSEPPGNLILGSDGKLYGNALSGGANGLGAIFSFDPVASLYTDIHDFDGTGGEEPEGSLLQAADGKLYGVASYGGANSSGAIFSIDTTAAHIYTDLFDFNGTNGLNPYTGLIQAADGKLYGTTANGGANQSGVVFSLDTTTAHVYTDLFDLTGTDGDQPYGTLVQAQNGSLYGTTSGGGANSYGVIFSYSISGGTYTDILDFDNVNGATPFSAMYQLPNGKLYGMTLMGGSAQIGVIFSFDPASATYALLDNFGTNLNGSNAAAGLLLASDGNMYGMTISGGGYGNGVIFKVDTSTLAYTVVFNFDGVHGSNPYGTLVQATDGKLYGMTSAGGVNVFNYFGVLFSFDPASATYTDLHDFDGIVAANPSGSLVQATDGKLYGMTSGLYTSGDGNIFSWDPLSVTYTSLYSFDTAGGLQPYGSLIQATDGNLYGLTFYGGANTYYGTLFSFASATSTYNDLYDFTGLTGSGGSPYGSLIQASTGKFYGLTSGDFSSSANSNIFSFDPVTSIFTDLQNMNSSGCEGTPVLVSDSVLYGTTNIGGISADGSIFSYNLNSSTFSDLFDFNGANGANPAIGSALLAIQPPSSLPVSLLDFYATLRSNNTVLLQWATAQEQNSSYFDVERSPDGSSFVSLGKVAAAGNSSSVLHYSFTDASPLVGRNFYRLDMVDLDGKQKYSPTLEVFDGSLSSALQILNNPFSSTINVKISMQNADELSLVLTDIIGRVLTRQTYQAQQGDNFMTIYPPATAEPGIYILSIRGTNASQTVKLIKQ